MKTKMSLRERWNRIDEFLRNHNQERTAGQARAIRDAIVPFVSWLAALTAVASFIVATFFRIISPDIDNLSNLQKLIGYVITGAWVILPPIWFWWEWVYLCSHLDITERERIKHMHELSRNIWVALVLVLTVVFGIKPFGGGG